jgi:3-methylcrotonyl-CoA carboxylase alpha subunit
MRRILVANRGEIACQVIRAARALGKETVEIYSEADAGALHTTLADIAVPIGPAPASQSCLDARRVLDAGLAHSADGVHPGYDFLSENVEFARAAEEAGRRWIGPSSECISPMGDKNRAREIAQSSDVPVLPGSGCVDASGYE